MEWVLIQGIMFITSHYMVIYRDRLQTMLSLIKRFLIKETDRWFWYTNSTFDKFSDDIDRSLWDSDSKIDEGLRERYARTLGRLRPIKSDLHVLLTMLHQAIWLKEMTFHEHLDTFYNMYYGTALADAFITKYRSSYDTIGKALIEIRRDRGHSPRQSFTELRKICNENEDVEILGEDLARLIQSCDWYNPLLDVRDEIVHRNLQVMGYLFPRILFQVYTKDENNFPVKMINIPEVMANENLVNFEVYAAVHIGYSFSLLEEFANLGYDILQVKKYPDSEETKVGYAGLDVLKDSIEKVLADQL